MAHVRGALPVVLTVGAGFVGYQYIYGPKHKQPVQIHDGITVDQPWPVWLSFNFWLCDIGQHELLSMVPLSVHY